MTELLTTIELAIRPYLSYFLSPTGNLIFSLMLFSFLVSIYFILRHWLTFRRIEKNRKRIPLVIGGWGTRGKSGSERLKAALFTSQGFRVIAKTTGSAAMFLRNVPGQDPMEIFLFRPYDKASIWEQQRMLGLAARSEAQVFLWECMALNRRYVEILQRQWMKDDVATITNAYADHEDIQGPTGMDVAKVISSFLPDKSRAFTTEVQMLPVLAETARKRRTELSSVPERDAQLLPTQLLSRFPYQEHPNNIALVARLAEEMGLEREQALFEMADHVVPEIGVLKAFPPAEVKGRRIQFVNGMSANERTGFLNNWRRVGFDRIGADDDGSHWAVAFVNNRADRISRSQIFARILAEDIFAHRIVLVGTNLNGMRGYLHDALRQFSRRHYLINARAYKHDTEKEIARAHLRLDAVRKRYRLSDTAFAATLNMAESMNRFDDHFNEATDSAGLEDFFTQWQAIAARKSVEEMEELLANNSQLAALVSRENHRFLLECAARHLVFDALDDLLERPAAINGTWSKGEINQLNGMLQKHIQQQVLRSLIIIPDALLKADRAIRTIVANVPKGYMAHVMGLQNIKGPGLDMVYRWQAYEQVGLWVAQLDDDDLQRRLDAVSRLHAFEDYGLLDAELAHAKVEQILDANDSPWEPLRPSLEKLHHSLHRTIMERKADLTVTRRFNPGRWLIRQVESLMDFVNSISRRRAADQIYKDLLMGRISQKRAAAELRELTQSQKGGWLKLSRLLGKRF